LSWREPAESTGQSATAAELLPLLVHEPVKQPNPPAKAEPDEDTPEVIDLVAVARGTN